MPLRIEAALFFIAKKFILVRYLMKKYKIVKGLALAMAIFAVICFFGPLAICEESAPEYCGTSPLWVFNILIGNFVVFGVRMTTIPSAWKTIIAMTWVSLIIAIASLVLVIFTYMSTDKNGLNKHGKIHKVVLIAIGLTLLSALLNFIILHLGASAPAMTTDKYFYKIDMSFAFVPLIPIAIITLIETLVLIKAKTEIANAGAAPQDEQSKKVKSKGAKSQISTGADDSPEGKTLEWFSSEAGLEVYKAYITLQNYTLEEMFRKKQNVDTDTLTSEHFERFILKDMYPDAKLPCVYFNDFIKSLNADRAKSSVIREMLIIALDFA